MTGPRPAPDERILELLADRAVFGLSAAEHAELETLLAAHPVADPEAFDRIAADLARASVPADPEPMPAHVLARIAAGAPAHAPMSALRPAAPRPRKLWFAAGGLAVAAALLLAVFLWPVNRPAPAPTAAERRNDLIAQAGRPGSDVIRLDWTATADPAAAGASGDVVWSTATQEGYMLFRGLAPNTPARDQYQLWVFDAARDERYPVDGGVFDVPADGGEVIVPIRVKLGVSRPTLFAVSVERPGGVVVSGRERLPLVAKAPPPNAG